MSIKIHFLPCHIKATKTSWQVVTVLLEGKVIGSCNLSFWGGKNPAIESVFVDPKYRNKGVGRSMINACIDECESCRKESLYLTVNVKNKKAIKLYKKLGFFSLINDGTTIWMGLRI